MKKKLYRVATWGGEVVLVVATSQSEAQQKAIEVLSVLELKSIELIAEEKTGAWPPIQLLIL